MKREKRRIGEIIKQVRLARGMTQVELSEHVGVSYQQVQKYEKAGNNISVERLKQIAKAVEVPLALFFSGTAEMAAVTPAVKGKKIAEDEAHLIRLYRRIKSVKSRKAVIELLKTFGNR